MKEGDGSASKKTFFPLHDYPSVFARLFLAGTLWKSFYSLLSFLAEIVLRLALGFVKPFILAARTFGKALIFPGPEIGECLFFFFFFLPPKTLFAELQSPGFPHSNG